MSAAQPMLFDETPPPVDESFAYSESEPETFREASTWRDYDTDPVPDVRGLPLVEQRKRCMARFVYRHRNELTPKAFEIGNEHRRITWGEWFQLRYGQSLDDYELQLKQQQGR